MAALDIGAFVRLALPALAILLGAAGPSTAQAPRLQSKAKVKPAPVAFIIAQGHYLAKELEKLEHTVGYAVELANELDKLGYRVQFAADTDSLAEAKKKGLAKGIVAMEVNDAAKLDEAIRLWIKTAAAANPSLAVLALSGHGEERTVFADQAVVGKPVAYYFCRDDLPGKSGLAVPDIATAAADYPTFPLFVVYNACRVSHPLPVVQIKNADLPKKVEPKEEEAPGVSRSTQPGAAKMRIRLVKETGQLTVLYAAQTGRVAFARPDLIAFLAKGLRYDGEVKQVLAYTHPEMKGVPSDLTVYYWSYYAMVSVLRTHKLAQSPVLDFAGDVRPDTIVARYNPNGRRWEAPKGQAGPVDLMRRFEPVYGDFTASFDAETGWAITKPVAATQQSISGWLGGMAGYDTSDRILELEAVAYHKPKGKVLRDWDLRLAFGLQPLHQDIEDSTKVVPLSSDRTAHTMMYHQMVTIQIPIEEKRGPKNERLAMNAIGMEAPQPAVYGWPDEATLIISRMRLMPQPLQRVRGFVITQCKQDVASRWLANDPDAAAPLEQKFDAKHRGLLLSADPTVERICRRGGDVFPPVYAPKDHVLEVELRETTTKDSTVTVELMRVNAESGKVVAVCNATPVTVRAGQSVKMAIPLATDGYANYFALSTASRGVQLNSAVIVPQKKKK